MLKNINKGIVSVMLSTTVLAAVSPLASAQDLKNDIRQTYASDPTTLDYTFSMRDTTTSHIVNFVEGLYENDPYGDYIPAAAESHEVSEDGLTYTYKIRKGIKWVDMNGNEFGETTAHDWVTGLQHAVDAQSEMLPIVQDSIKGLNEYMKGEIEFDEVGVKALDDYTLQYTLTKPEPFFNSKTTYGILYPINQEFLDSKGDEFGSLSPDSILYNGPFLLQNLTSKSVIEYSKNENYWDKGNVFVDKVSMTFNDNSDPEVFFRLFKDNALDSFIVNPTLPIYDKVKETYPDGVTVQQPAGSTLMLQFNLNREAQDATAKNDPAQFESTKKAIANKKFRQAIMFGFDRATYMQQTHGDEFKNEAIRNTLVPPTFVNIEGEPFGNRVAKYLEEMNPELYGGINLEDKQDGLFNPEKAKKLMEEARQELEGQGVQFPIHLDLPTIDQNPLSSNLAKSIKSSIETSLGADNIVVEPVLLNQDSYLAATFNATIAEEIDYDFTNEMAWIPDYLDPSTYLDIYDPTNGTFLIPIGFNPVFPGEEDPTQAEREATGLMEYKKLLDEAAAIIDDMDKRYDAYAKAQAFLTDSAISIPIRNFLSNVRMTRYVPFSAPYAFAGPGSLKLKFVKLQKEPVSQEQYKKALEEWKANLADVSIKSDAPAGDQTSDQASEVEGSDEGSQAN